MYSIGELAKISGISVKTLRFYDQEGILTPELRNAENGYRYYSDKQMMQVQIIKEMKPFGLSLEDIRNILQKQNLSYLGEKLQGKIDAITDEISKLNHQLMAVKYARNRLLEGENILNSWQEGSDKKRGFPKVGVNSIPYGEGIDVWVRPATWVLYTRYKSHLNAQTLFFERCLELQRMREQYNLFHSGAFIGIFHDGYASQFLAEDGDLELCLPVIKPDGFECDSLKSFGGFLVASNIHIGHYKDSYRAYLSLIEWIEKNNYEIIGPPFEEYLLDACSVCDPSRYVTGIHFPVAKVENE